MASNNINDDSCVIQQRQDVNNKMTNWQFFGPKYTSSCNANITPQEATNTYGTYHAMPVDLLETESALTGRMTRINKCNQKCPGGDISQLTTNGVPPPELCPIISRSTNTDYCNL